MTRIFLSVILLLLALTATAQGVAYSRQDSLRVVELLAMGAKAPADEPLTLFYARQFVDRPYVGHTLELKGEEQLAVNLGSLDCTTLVENVVALTLTTSHGSKRWEDFLHWLRMVRYDGGKLNGYSSRNHYFSQWIQSGEKLGLVREIVPDNSISLPMKLRLNYMSVHPNSYPLLRVDANERKLIAAMEKRISGGTVRYIPKTKVGESQKVLSCIQNGDILALTTNKAGLDVSHVGFAVWGEDGKLHLLNASSLHKKVVLESKTLHSYMQRQGHQTGVRVIRVIQ